MHKLSIWRHQMKMTLFFYTVWAGLGYFWYFLPVPMINLNILLFLPSPPWIFPCQSLSGEDVLGLCPTLAHKTAPARARVRGRCRSEGRTDGRREGGRRRRRTCRSGGRAGKRARAGGERKPGKWFWSRVEPCDAVS